MRTFGLLLSSCLLPFAACGSDVVETPDENPAQAEAETQPQTETGTPAAPQAESPVGLYALDAEALRAAMEALAAEAIPDPASRPTFELVSEMKGSLELKADGTSSLTMVIPQRPLEPPKPGTWTFADGKLLLTAKNAQGVDETREGTFVDGVITLEQDQGGQQVPMRWRRHAEAPK